MYILNCSYGTLILLTPPGPSKPRNLTVTKVLTDGIELNWIPPREPNGDVRYFIQYRTEGNDTLINTTITQLTYFNLTGLEEGTTYYIKVVVVSQTFITGRERNESDEIQCMYVGRAKFTEPHNFKVHFKLFSTDSCPKEITPTSVVIIGTFVFICIHTHI